MLTQPLGIAGLTELYPFNVPQIAFYDQIRSGVAAQVWMCEFEPLRGAPEAVPLPMMAGPGLGILGVVGLGELYNATMYRAAPAPIERHSSLAHGLNTTSADTPANARISNRLVSDQIQVSRLLPQIGQRLGGFVAETSAQIVLNGADGGLDHLFDGSTLLRDRPIRLKSAASPRLARGAIAKPQASAFASRFEGRIVNAQINVDGLVTLTVADGWKRLDRPIQERLYLGTGGREGGADLAGKPPPLAYGNCPNVDPTLLDRVLGIYQVHDGEVLDMAPKDMGVPLRISRDVASYEELAALATEGEVDEPDIPLGFAALCRAEGIFRVAGGVSITCDVQGDGLYDGPIGFRGGVFFRGGVGYKAPGARTHRRYPAGMIYRVLFSRARVRDSEIDLDQMLQFDAEYPYEMGIYISSNERPTVREVCTTIADSAGAVVARNRLGQITLRMLVGAAPSGPVTINEVNLAKPVERVPLPWGAPWPSIKLYFAPNWTVLDESRISLEVGDEERARLMQRSRMVEVAHPEMQPLLPDREALEVTTILRNEADARDVAKRMLDFYAGKHALWRAVAFGIGFRSEVLATAVLAADRFGLQGGVPMLVIGAEERPGDGETELTLM